jgi:RNA polymerase sigma-70 factor, ECF subfamily
MRPGGTRGGQGIRPIAEGPPTSSLGSYTRLVKERSIPFHLFGSIRESCRESLPRPGVTAILLPNQSEDYVELFAFTREYVERLREGEPLTEQHFVSYFDQILRIKLRARMLASETVEDLRQETYIRVLVALRSKDGVRQPERFGAFVNSICNNVLMEFYRASIRTRPLDDSHLEEPDHAMDLEGLMVSKQTKERVRQVIQELPKKDRDLLRAFFLEEMDKDEICRLLGVDRDYLRGLLHRAKDKFKVLYDKDKKDLSGWLPRGGET